MLIIMSQAFSERQFSEISDNSFRKKRNSYEKSCTAYNHPNLDKFHAIYLVLTKKMAQASSIM